MTQKLYPVGNWTTGVHLHYPIVFMSLQYYPNPPNDQTAETEMVFMDEKQLDLFIKSLQSRLDQVRGFDYSKMNK